MFVYAPLCHWLLDTCGWRGTLMLLATVWIHGMVAASLLKPLPKTAHKNAELYSSKHSVFYSSMTGMAGSTVLATSYHSLSTIDQQCQRHHTSSKPDLPDSLCAHMSAAIKNMVDVKAFANVYVILFTLVQLFVAAFPMIPVYLPKKMLSWRLEYSASSIVIVSSRTCWHNRQT